MDRSPSPRALYPSAVHRERVRLPRATVRSIAGGVCQDPWDGSANRDDSRHAKPHLASQKNRHSRAPVFWPCTLVGRKFLSCGRRQKKCLQNSSRDPPTRDTSFRMEEEVRVLSYPFDPERVTTAVGTACIHKCGLGILQQRFNERLRFASIYWFGIDHVVF